jgi:hypothetical protein
MPASVNLQTISPALAAVRREVAPGAGGSGTGLDLRNVSEFIPSQPSLYLDELWRGMRKEAESS